MPIPISRKSKPPALTLRTAEQASWRRTAEIRGLVYTPAPLVSRHLWIRAQRTRAINTRSRVMTRNDLRGRISVLHPCLHCTDLVEIVRPLSALTMAQTNEVEPRPLSEADAAAWWHLRFEALQTEPSAFGRALEDHQETTVEETAARFRSAPACDFTLGAFDASGALAAIATFVREPGLKGRHKGHIYGVFVTRAHRGKGLGLRILTALLQHARTDPSLEQILISVSTTQQAARRLYEKLGFKTYGVEPRALKIGSAYIDEELMILRVR